VIEVNLLPGGKKRSGGGGFSFKMPKLPGLGGGGGGGAGAMDSYQIFFAVAAAIGLGYIGWSFIGLRSETEELNVQLETQIQDSIRFSAIIEQTNELEARAATLEARVAIIQQIDAERYVWPHLLDEIAAAVPDFMWLREVLYSQEGPPLEVRITGRAASIFVITNFMRRLEASRYLRTVAPQTMQQVASDANPDDLVYMFELVANYESPPQDELETVPLFTEGSTAQSPSGGGN